MSTKNQATMSAYLTEPVIADIEAVGKSMDRTPSWLLRKAWELAREQIIATTQTAAQ